ncbi:uncharacterized protein Dmoj_GI21387 [Drosophila mojavensis]|uniref:DUF4794 domain-containing protein n=1 Tax=Drosophila mojavensis TaxID=7230 RepID=B4KG30_DROMO|nr:uncharacterized protein Dmoj_GI21387 [Drosophila mojavensis]
MKQAYTLLCVVLLTASLAVPSAARGGRGRGSGSFGGLFGGWRSKYGSKSSSSGSGRRVVSGSPVHTAMTVPKLPPPPPPPVSSKVKPHVASYPRQQPPPPPGYGYAPAASQGTYYANAQALPAGAVYYAQPPTSMGIGPGTGFLTGLLAGRLMDNVLFGHHQHVSHVYHQNQEGQPASGNGREIIIINNGQQQTEGETQQPPNDSLSPVDAVASPANPFPNKDVQQEGESDEEAANSTAMPVAPAGGIICFPIMINETDPQNPELVNEVQRVVCFPAPTADPQSADCQNDPICVLQHGGSTTSTVPPIVAGDIGGAAAASDSLEVSTPAADVDTPQD